VLRLSRRIDPASAGAPRRSDIAYTTHFGVSANVPISQQLIQGEYTWYKSRYRTFKDLDFSGHTARAHWQWMVQQKFYGTLGYTESQGLASFSNIQSREPDLVTSRQAYATGNWNMSARYRSNAGLTASQTRHGDPLRKANDIDQESGEVGISYVTPLDNSFGAVVRVEHGRIPNGITLGGLPFDNAYRQYGVGAMVTWVLTGHSRFDGRVDAVHRVYEQVTQRNYSGPIVRLLYTWTPTGKLTVTAAITRDVGPADEINTSFVLVTGAYIRPRWNVSDKVALQGNVEYNVWDYRGDPLTGQSFTHRVRHFGGSVSYRPTQKVLLQAGINRELRTSTLPTGDYEVDVAFVEGRVGF
jgi:exopolysaccharide biosynthesis operon protein EpsL